MTVGPGDEIAAGADGNSSLRASHADREQVLDALKTAFVQGRLTKDEFDSRVSKVLATYAELDALTADIPAGLTEAPSPEIARKSHNRKLIQRGTAAGAAVSAAFAAVVVMAAGGNPLVGLVVVPLLGSFVAVLLAGLLTLVSWVLEKGSSRQPSPGPPPSADVNASRRLTPTDSAERLRQIRHDPRHNQGTQPKQREAAV